MSVGRSQRTIPDRLRRLVLFRDGHRCQVPGCTATRGLDLHHIIHWSDDGPTDSWNLITICSRHHRMHHKHRLGISGNADRPDTLRFVNARGVRSEDPVHAPHRRTRRRHRSSASTTIRSVNASTAAGSPSPHPRAHTATQSTPRVISIPTTAARPTASPVSRPEHRAGFGRARGLGSVEPIGPLSRPLASIALVLNRPARRRVIARPRQRAPPCRDRHRPGAHSLTCHPAAHLDDVGPGRRKARPRSASDQLPMVIESRISVASDRAGSIPTVRTTRR